MSYEEGSIELKEEKKDSILVLRISGRLDAISSPAAEKKVFEHINSGEHHLLLDFSKVGYLSSAGMRMLLSTTKKLKTLSGKMILYGIHPNVMDVLKMSGFDHVLDIVETEQEAMSKF